MKVKSGMILQPVGDGFVLVPEGGVCGDFRGVIRLNKTAAAIWEGIRQGKNTEELSRMLLERYDGLDQAEAQRAVAAVIKELGSAGLFED